MSSLLVYNRVNRLEIQSVMLVFRPSFVNYCPSNLLSGSPPPLPKVKVQYTVYRVQTVCGWKVGVGVLSCVHILQLYQPKQKLRRGGGLRQINTCRKVPLQVNCSR